MAKLSDSREDLLIRVTIKKSGIDYNARHSHLLSDFSVNLSYTELCCTKWNVDSPDGCHYNISEWRARRQNLHETT